MNIPTCKSCKSSLTPVLFQGKTWYRCDHCKFHLVPVRSFKQVLSGYEYTRFVSEIQKGQIKSSDICPVCKTRMGKVIDLVEVNEVEVCASCELVWLDPREGQKIKIDQLTALNTEKKTKLSGETTISANYSLPFLSELAKTNPFIAFVLSVIIVIAVITVIGYAFRHYGFYPSYYRPGIHIYF